MRMFARTLAAALLAAAVFSAPARAEGPVPVTPATVTPAGPPGDTAAKIGGHWTGAKLRCQKEVGKLVRCGTPAPFEITFSDAGTGTTPDENLPQEFTWRWTAAQELGMTPKAGGDEIKLFAVEHPEEDILTFQAYVYLPTADPNAPVEVRYIHYVFDVSRAQ